MSLDTTNENEDGHKTASIRLYVCSRFVFDLCISSYFMAF